MSRSRIRGVGALKAALLIAVLTLVAGCGRGSAPLPPESLQIRINLLCTTCDEFVRCDRSDVEDARETYRIYRLREKSVWAQIATIWDYLVQWIQRKTTDERPLTVYDSLGGSKRVVSEEGRAQLDMVSGTLTLPDSAIDLRSGEWRTPAGAPQGQCRTLPRREGYAWVRAMLGKSLPKGASP